MGQKTGFGDLGSWDQGGGRTEKDTGSSAPTNREEWAKSCTPAPGKGGGLLRSEELLEDQPGSWQDSASSAPAVCTPQQDSRLRMASSAHSGPAPSYLSGDGRCSWEGVSGSGPSWAWLSEALRDRVSHLLVGEATSPGTPSRAAATHRSAGSSQALHLQSWERVSSREGGGEAHGGEGAL